MLTHPLSLTFGAMALTTGFLAYFLIHNDRGAKEPTAALWEALGFGVVAIALALLAESPLAPIDKLVHQRSASLLLIFGFALAVGLIEELSKFLPLAVFIRGKSYFNEHTDGIIYFALVGISFSVLENLLYINHYGNGTGVARIILLLFFHSATSGIVGYFFARAKIRGESLARTGLVLLSMAGLHGLYDFGLFSGVTAFILVSLLLTMVLNGGLFFFYERGSERDQAAGLSAVGENKFCRHCGWPNPKHYLYCEHCGGRA